MSSPAARALTTAAHMRMRILALPLTSGAASSGRYTYYHFQMPPRDPEEEGARPSLVKRAMGKAAELWAGFGKAPEGNWRRRTYTYGEKLMDRIEFEEQSLKILDPSLGPRPHRLDKPHLSLEEARKLHISIPLIHPTFFGNAVSPLQHLQTMLQKRAPAHRKGFYFWMLISPLTAPFMLIPIIPNLPFFFCVWRSYHHYRAYKAATYVNALLEEGAIEPEADAELDKIYETHKPASVSASAAASASASASPPSPTTPSNEPPQNRDTTRNDTTRPSPRTAEGGKSAPGPERIILRKDAAPEIVAAFHLSPHVEADLVRALEQTGQRLGAAKT